MTVAEQAETSKTTAAHGAGGNGRLPPQPGEWIDRSRTLNFMFENQSISGFSGDAISSALWANGIRVLGRSFKYHRPRGIYTLANHDCNALFQTESATNIRGDVTPLADGINLKAVNTFGGLRGDWARFMDWFSAFLPVGFYYKAFHTPRFLFPFWERMMRRAAGLGSVDPGRRAAATPKAYEFCDVLVVGAGPAGMAAAIAAGETGLRIVLVDESPRIGGSLTYQRPNADDTRSRFKEFSHKLDAMPNVHVRTSTTVGGCYADRWLALFDETRMTKLRAGGVVFATGCAEQPAVFRNNDLPGIMLASAAQRLIGHYAVKPFESAVIVAGNSDAYRAALDLHRAGVRIAAVADLRSEGDAAEAAAIIRDVGTEVHFRHAVYDAFPANGMAGIRGAVLCQLDKAGRPRPESVFPIDCDGIAMSVGWAPAAQLLYQAGVRGKYDGNLEQLVPEDLPAGIFAAGRVRGVYNLPDQINDGTHAGTAAAEYVRDGTESTTVFIAHEGPPPSHPYPIMPHAAGKNFVDLDEDVQLKDLENSVQEGFDNSELLKRYSTVGMGPSQGKHAIMNTARCLAFLRNRDITEGDLTTSRPFYTPVRIGHLAGRNFHPLRRTPIHNRHEAAHAEFMYAGDWQRPACYRGDRRSRTETIRDEIVAVRNQVGLIDVGTLGKIDVRGPDAVEFVERLYTGRIAKLKIGMMRYLAMCDESGIVVDDGIAARLAEDHVYLTATTNGANAVVREMRRWAILWGLNVSIINYTGQYAAFNLAGPASRKVMSAVTEVDLEAESFPYLGLRLGAVCAAPARIMRVGFVGELGYEVHVPVQFAGRLWDGLMEAGRDHGIRPFGVEAQRVLRLEKGHIIIGQDTDGLTNPFEAGMGPAVARKKPFFIGQRSLSIIRSKPETRRLVGFMLRTDYSGPIPKECHLVIADGEMIGRVTSGAESPTLSRVIGLAYVPPDNTEPGTKLTIRVDGGMLVEAAVARLPFYDPENTRQAGG